MPKMMNNVHARRYTDQELLEILKELTGKLGHVPTARELEIRTDMPSSLTYSRRFGSWRKALEVAGLNANAGKYTDRELLDSLKGLADELGRVPKLIEVDLCKSMPAGKTYVTRFGSWEKTLELAKLK